MPVTHEDIAESTGPNASLPPGGAKEMADLTRQTTSAGKAQPPPSGGPPQGGPPSQQSGPQAQPGPPAAQVPQATPIMPVRPPAQQQAWRQRLAVWAEHPDAEAVLKAIGVLAKLDQLHPEQMAALREKHGRPPQ